MNTLGIDPGLRHVGLCWTYSDQATKPTRYEGPQTARLASRGVVQGCSARSAYDAHGNELWSTNTLRRNLKALPAGDREDVLWVAQLANVPAVIDLGGVDLVAIEDFTHRPYLRRAISNAPRMGELVGRLFAAIAATGMPVIRIPAEISKAGTGHARRWHRNGHEYSAWAVATAARSTLVRKTYS